MSSRRFWVAVFTSLTLVTFGIGWGVNTYLIDKRIELAGERLALLGTLRRDALERYLDTAAAELSFWGANDFILEQQAWIVAAWQEAVAAGATQRRICGKRILRVTHPPLVRSKRRTLPSMKSCMHSCIRQQGDSLRSAVTTTFF